MFFITMHVLARPARAERLDCFPVSKQIATQVLGTPMNQGGILVVVEDSLCDHRGENPPAAQPAEIVPVDARRALTPIEVAVARAAGSQVVQLGPADFQATTRSVVASVDEALDRPGFSRVEVVGTTLRVTAGESAFLDLRVDVRPDACPDVSSEGWTVHTTQYCILDQIGGGVFAPRQMFPGWAGAIPNEQLRGDDLPLLEALVQLYTVNGVQPWAFFLLSEPGRPDGGPTRRLTLEVHYPALPPIEPGQPGTFVEDYPGRPEKVFREVPGDDD